MSVYSRNKFVKELTGCWGVASIVVPLESLFSLSTETRARKSSDGTLFAYYNDFFWILCDIIQTLY